MKFEGPSNTDTGLIWCPDVKYRVFPGSHIKMPLGRMIRNAASQNFWSETMLIDPCLMHVSVLNSWRRKLKCCGRLWKTMIMTCMCNHISCHCVCNGFPAELSLASCWKILPTKDWYDKKARRIMILLLQGEVLYVLADAKGWDNACLSQRLTLIIYTVYTLLDALILGNIQKKTEVLALFSCKEIPMQQLIQCWDWFVS